jgi:hypothetical protein
LRHTRRKSRSTAVQVHLRTLISSLLVINSPISPTRRKCCLKCVVRRLSASQISVPLSFLPSVSQSLEKLEKLYVDHLLGTIYDQQTRSLSATDWCSYYYRSRPHVLSKLAQWLEVAHYSCKPPRKTMNSNSSGEIGQCFGEYRRRSARLHVSGPLGQEVWYASTRA